MSKYNVHAGHNSIVPGAAKYLNEVTENRKVKNKLIQLLRAAGNTVYDCTDEGGDTQSKNLANIVAKCNAHSVDLDISIHLNAGSGTGTEVLYTSEKGKAYAAKVSAAVAAALGIKDRGAKERNDLYVLNHTKAPAILVECCFVDSTTDRDKWDVDKCAAAIVQGITGKAAAMENNTGIGSGKTDEAEKTEADKKETSSAKTVNYKAKINTASGVNVRKGPGEDYSKITAVANGKTTTITKEQDGWGYAKEYAGWMPDCEKGSQRQYYKMDPEKIDLPWIFLRIIRCRRKLRIRNGKGCQKFPESKWSYRRWNCWTEYLEKTSGTVGRINRKIPCRDLASAGER